MSVYRAEVFKLNTPQGPYAYLYRIDGIVQDVIIGKQSWVEALTEAETTITNLIPDSEVLQRAELSAATAPNQIGLGGGGPLEG